jgi:hypothetical protein
MFLMRKTKGKTQFFTLGPPLRLDTLQITRLIVPLDRHPHQSPSELVSDVEQAAADDHHFRAFSLIFNRPFVGFLSVTVDVFFARFDPFELLNVASPMFAKPESTQETTTLRPDQPPAKSGSPS